MSEYTSISISLSAHQWEWLEQMTSKHNLRSVSKALRICITCVAMGDVKAGLHNAIPESNFMQRQIQLSPQQLQYIRTNYSNTSQAIQLVVSGCSVADEYTVFGVVRCKSSITKCEGASDAILDIAQRYDKNAGDVMENAKENITI